MEYAASRGVSVMCPVLPEDLDKPVFKKYWADNIAKKGDIPEAEGINKIDIAKFAVLEKLFRQQAQAAKEKPPIIPLPALPFREENTVIPERPDAQSRDPFSGSEYVYGLTPCNFREFLERKDMVFVMFYDEDSGNEKSLWAKTQLNKAARATRRENHGYAAVNCTLNRDLCDAEGVCDTPMYKMYSRGNEVSKFEEVCSFHAPEIKTLVETAPLLTGPRKAVPYTNS